MDRTFDFLKLCYLYGQDRIQMIKRDDQHHNQSYFIRDIKVSPLTCNLITITQNHT